MPAFRFRILVAAAVSTASLLVISSLGRRPTTPPHPARLVRVGSLALRVVRAGRTIFVCVAEAWAHAGARETLVATLQGTMMCLQGRGLSG
mgnify:CR=1 FL=1